MITCQAYTGGWAGTLHDTTHLFSKKANVSLCLKSEDHKLIGYIRNNSQVYHAGTLISATCNKGKITQIHVFPRHIHCAFMLKNAGELTDNTLNLTLPYENAMIDTSFKGQFKRVRMSSVNQKWMEDARQINFSRISGCH